MGEDKDCDLGLGVRKEHDKLIPDSHPSRYLAARTGDDEMPLRLPAIRFEGHVLCCDTSKLELRGVMLRIMKAFISRRGRLSPAALRRLVKSTAAATSAAGLDEEVRRVVGRLRVLCEASFGRTHPQLCWFPQKSKSSPWLLLQLRESYVLAHTHERGRVANLFHRHQFHYEPTM